MDIAQRLQKTKVGVLYGGRSSEREISLLSGGAVLKALRKAGVDAVGVDVGPDLPFQLKRRRIGFAYIALHGPWGEDGTVQGLLEIMGIPYSGCGVLSSALSMNKVYTKRILDSHGLPTARWTAFTRGRSRYGLPRGMSLPVVVKPATQGSAIGITVVRRRGELASALETAFAYDADVLVEEYVAGTEVTAGVLGGRALPVVEIVPAGEFYDFKSKYSPGQSRHLVPPRLPAEVVRRVRDLALKTFAAFDCRAVARVDMIVGGDGVPRILELNTIPGMTETSLLPDAAKAAGMSFGDLVAAIIEHSLPQARTRSMVGRLRSRGGAGRSR